MWRRLRWMPLLDRVSAHFFRVTNLGIFPGRNYVWLESGILKLIDDVFEWLGNEKRKEKRREKL